MSVIRTLVGGGQIFFCPGCKSTHAVNTSGPRWTYNGDVVKPTFTPSILVTYGGVDADEDENEDDGLPSRCHSFVKDGMIQFLGDCTHELSDKSVPIPEWPYAPGSYGGVVD